MEQEIWKTIPGHPLYEVSTHGNVRSFNNNRWGRRKEPKPIKIQTYKNTNYLRVNLDSKYYSLHRIVCETFNPNPHDYPIVLHIDNNPHNNHYTNLKWGTQSENILQCSHEGRHRHYKNKP